MSGWIYLTPVVSALVGWLLSSVAVGYFFKKHLPANKAAFALRLVSTNVITFDGMEERLAGVDGMKKLMPVIEHHIDDFLRNKLVKSMPVVGMFIGEKTIGQLKDIFLQELELIFPAVMKTYLNNIREEMDLKQLVVKQLESSPPGKFEEGVRVALRNELRLFGFFGAVSGLVTGIIQLSLLLAIQ